MSLLGQLPTIRAHAIVAYRAGVKAGLIPAGQDPDTMDDTELVVAVILALFALVAVLPAGLGDGGTVPQLPQPGPQPAPQPPAPAPQPQPQPGPAAPPAGVRSGDGRSEASPIMAMPIEGLAAQVRSSAAYWGRDDDEYWITHADHAGQFSNGLFYIGWNAYWFYRMDPNNEGSADPNLAGQPAPY